MEIGCQNASLDMLLDDLEKAIKLTTESKLQNPELIDWMLKYQQLYKQKYAMSAQNTDTSVTRMY